MKSAVRPVASSPRNKPLLSVPGPALDLQKTIITNLKKLIACGYKSCLCTGFKNGYARILGLFEDYQHEVMKAGPYTMTCKKGCGTCCYHWAEDVYSFEGKILAEHIQKKHGPEIESIMAILKQDALWRDRIKSAVMASMKNAYYKKAMEKTDPYDIVLSGFYQLKRPCPLREKDGSCSVYAIRPLTCRIYVSFSHPRYCKPEYINEGKARTYLLDLEKDASDLFDELHFMYDECEGETGLRSMLLKLLSAPPHGRIL
jgi:Fe-S-cluster containining protein